MLLAYFRLRKSLRPSTSVTYSKPASRRSQASKAFSLSTRYLFGLYLFRVMSLYWSHKEHGEKALGRVEAFFEDLTLETPRKEET